MALGTVGEGMWRMLRRIELHENPGAVPWAEFRNWNRDDAENVALLVRLKLIVGAGPECYTLTDAGREVARLGQIEAEVISGARAAERAAQRKLEGERKAAAKRLRKKAEARRR